MKSAIDRMKVENTEYKISVFRQKQGMPYEAKVAHAEIRVREFYNKIIGDGHNVHVSVGGLDSITLLLFLRSIRIDVPAVSVSCLEDKSIQRIHRKLGVIALKPLKSKTEVLQEFGFPVLSKEVSKAIDRFQNPTTQNAASRHASVTGICKDGHYSKYMQLSKQWLELFAGYENQNEGTSYKTPPFLVSERCCYYQKERPCDIWAKEHDSYPYQGLLASEGGRRERALTRNGCNYYGKTTTRSCPFAIFSRQDLLQLALDLQVPVPEIYGDIVRDADGTLRTTKAQRTGCSMCGFGIHLEKRPHRFDRLYQDNPKEWEFWMYRCVTDPKTGEKFGWGRVLDYIGVGWRPEEIDGGITPCCNLIGKSQ